MWFAVPSAFKALSNAVCTFDVASAGTSVDPLTGNVEVVTEQVQVEMWLKVMDLGVNPFPGVDTIGVVYEGYCVEPMALDSRVVVGTRGAMVFAGELEQDCEVLEVRLPYGKSGVLAEVLNKVAGEKVWLVGRRQG